MRDQERIDRMLKLLKDYWKKNPDMRLGQIVVNAAGAPKDLYYTEDKDTEWGLQYLDDTCPQRGSNMRGYIEDDEYYSPISHVFSEEEEAEYDEAVKYFATLKRKGVKRIVTYTVATLGLVGSVVALVLAYVWFY